MSNFLANLRVETPSDGIMCNTSNAIFLLFIYNIKIALSGILNPDNLELNIGKLEFLSVVVSILHGVAHFT